MYKSDYFTEEQMTKYKMQMDADKVWMATLQFFTNLYTQRKVYGVDRAANSGFDSAALVHKYPPTKAIAPLPAQPTTSQRATSTSRVSKNHWRRHTNMLPRSEPRPWSLTRRPLYARNLKPNASSLISS